MIYYINKYFSNNNPPDLLFVDLASTNHFNIRNNIYLINLPDITKKGCISCNIYNFLKIKKNHLYLLLKNQKNSEENGIYLYSFKSNDILQKIHKIEFNQINSNEQHIFVINGVINGNTLYKYDYENKNTYIHIDWQSTTTI